MADIEIVDNKISLSDTEELLRRSNELENSILSVDNTEGSEKAKFGDSTNYLEIQSNGHQKFNGSATVWLDELQSLIKEASNNPASRIILNYAEGTVDFKDNATLDDYGIMNIQLNHCWKIGSIVRPHLHWFQNQNAVPNWLFQYRWQKNGGAKITNWSNQACGEAVYTYTTGTILQINTNCGITPPEGVGLSDILQVRIIRDTANTSGEFAGADAYTGNASALNFDIHIECDTVGSNQEFVK